MAGLFAFVDNGFRFSRFLLFGGSGLLLLLKQCPQGRQQFRRIDLLGAAPAAAAQQKIQPMLQLVDLTIFAFQRGNQFQNDIF